MKKNSLNPNQGLSLSQAQSISNLCNQRAREIDANISGVNNCEKTVEISSKTHIILAGKPLPTNIVSLLIEKAELHACQAFLMENIKAKDFMLKTAKNERADDSVIEMPEKPKFVNPSVNMLPEVGEDWGWSQLSIVESNEFLEAEAYAAHIGQFIHSGMPLDVLRTELVKLPAIEWMEIKTGEKTPVTIKKHHSPEQLMSTHEVLAKLHRDFEQRVNYFKSKVKNITTLENARIAKHNADAQNDAQNTNNQLQAAYETAYKAYSEAVKSLNAEFEKTRQAKIKEIASMRIGVDARFQKVVDTFLTKVTEEE